MGKHRKLHIFFIHTCSRTFMNQRNLFKNTFPWVERWLKSRTLSQGQHSFYFHNTGSSQRIITRENRAIQLIWESLQHRYAKVWWGKTALRSATHPLQLCAIRHAEFPSSASLTVARSGIWRRHRLHRGWNETLQRLSHFFYWQTAGREITVVSCVTMTCIIKPAL